MNINIKRIIAEKTSAKVDSMDALFKNAKCENTLESYMNYIDILSKESNNVIAKNMGNLLENYTTMRFLNFFVSTESCGLEDLNDLNKEIGKRIEECGDSCCEKKDVLLDTQKKVSNIIESQSSMDWLRIDTKYRFACERYNSACLYESSKIVDDLDMIIYTINMNPNAINQYAKLLAKIETTEFSKIEQSFPALLKLNTDMILGLDVTLTGKIMLMVTSMPTVIAKRLILDGSIKQKKAFINIIDKQLYNVKAQLKNGNEKQYPVLNEYITNLYQAKDMLTQNCNSLPIKEHIADMQPNIIMYEDGVIEDPVAELEDLLSDIIFDDDDDICDKSLESLCVLQTKINHIYSTVEEGKVSNAVRKGAYKVADKSNKLASKVANARSEAKRTATAVKKGADPFINMTNKLINDMKNMDRNERRERIITGQFKLKLFKSLKKLIVMLTAGAVVYSVGFSPAGIVTLVIAIISLLAGVAVDKKLDDKVRREIIHELETELAVVNEKLEDSRGDEKKENKYQLIRIKKKLESDLDRIKYHLRAKDTDMKTN